MGNGKLQILQKSLRNVIFLKNHETKHKFFYKKHPRTLSVLTNVGPVEAIDAVGPENTILNKENSILNKENTILNKENTILNKKNTILNKENSIEILPGPTE